MQAVQYSERSIAVFGDTKPWAKDLSTLGGKINYNLKTATGTAPGWIFSNTKRDELAQFVANANAGLLQPGTQIAHPQTQQTQQTYPPMVPFGQVNQGMTPQEAMARLTVAQPTAVPFPQVIIPLPQVGTHQPARPLSPQVGTYQPMRPLSPKPVTLAQTQAPVTLDFPNRFVAADGLTYQIIMYTAPVPSVGQLVTLRISDTDIEFVVTEANKFDDILITKLEVMEDMPNDPSRAAIVAGKWQVPALQENHTITFHPVQ